MSETMKGYKGFKKGMICDPTGENPFQYAENTVFEQESEAGICESGFHFCKNPLDVLKFYPLVDDEGNMSEFAEVEALDEVKTDDNKKYCTKKLKIGAKLSFPALVQASLDFESEKAPSNANASGDSARIGSSGDYAQIGSSGNYAQIGSSGKNSVICCAGANASVKAKRGSWITLSEWKFSKEKNRSIPVCVKTEYVDGERIKEDTFYMLKNGEFVEVV